MKKKRTKSNNKATWYIEIICKMSVKERKVVPLHFERSSSSELLIRGKEAKEKRKTEEKIYHQRSTVIF